MKKINRQAAIVIVIVGVLIVVIYNFFIKKEDFLDNNYDLNIFASNEGNVNEVENLVEESNDSDVNKIVVYITGAVKKEGMYELDENSRIADGIEKAGGLTEEAYIDNINLAFVLQDGMKVRIPKKSEKSNVIEDDTDKYVSIGESITENVGDTMQNSKTDKININTASQTELETLPGIGASTALKIINYRKDNGKFSKIEDIKNVSGIGDSKYDKIKDLIKV
ncbi:MAG: helix-hairpin-helix domain-containing protein [Clostridia bacterium]|nr:helix-hairpin-helix domain-containing protein [Clostridia bacterium]